MNGRPCLGGAGGSLWASSMGALMCSGFEEEIRLAPIYRTALANLLRKSCRLPDASAGPACAGTTEKETLSRKEKGRVNSPARDEKTREKSTPQVRQEHHGASTSQRSIRDLGSNSFTTTAAAHPHNGSHFHYNIRFKRDWSPFTGRRPSFSHDIPPGTLRSILRTQAGF